MAVAVSLVSSKNDNYCPIRTLKKLVYKVKINTKSRNFAALNRGRRSSNGNAQSAQIGCIELRFGEKLCLKTWQSIG